MVEATDFRVLPGNLHGAVYSPVGNPAAVTRRRQNFTVA